MSSKFIVYINEFDRYDDDGNMICRNTKCNNHSKYPFRKYCSKKCQTEFRRWYYHNFFWERVRSDIFKRDDYTCQICKETFPYKYRKKFVRSKKLECDHIIPKSLYPKLGYKFDTFENKVRTTIEFFHNHQNLRTLCSKCHKKVTSEYMGIKQNLYDKKDIEQFLILQSSN